MLLCGTCSPGLCYLMYIQLTNSDVQLNSLSCLQLYYTYVMWK